MQPDVSQTEGEWRAVQSDISEAKGKRRPLQSDISPSIVRVACASLCCLLERSPLEVVSRVLSRTPCSRDSRLI